MISFDELHDATLLMFEVDWDSGDARFDVRTASMKVAIRVKGLILLKCPRQFPWGPSVSVNTAKLDRLADVMQLSVEMQSGDVIEVCAEKIFLEEGK